MKSSKLFLRFGSWLSTVSLMGACSQRPPPASSAALPEGVVAEVAGQPIPTALVRETGLAVERAVEQLVRAELFVVYVNEHDPALLRVAERASLARALLESLRTDALNEAV